MPIEELTTALERAKQFFLAQIKQKSPLTEGKKSESLNPLIESGKSTAASADSPDPSQYFQKSIHIYSHLDADGLCAAAILGQTLKRAGIGYQITILRQLETEYIAQIREEIILYNRFIIFSDFGTGQFNILKDQINTEDILILDHHAPLEINEKPPDNHVNPYFFGFDGSYEISGAGICYLFAKTMDPNNIDMASFAIIGALGDLQNKGEKGEFKGLNLIILQDAIKSGKMTTELNLAISRSRPITQAIAFTLPDRVPGLSGNEEAARLFLEKHQIKVANSLNDPRTLLELSDLERKTLNTALIQYGLVEKKMSPEFVQKLITTFYILTDYDSKEPVADAREMSSLLNACGRSGHPSLGIAALLGDKSALQDAMAENKLYRKDIYKAMQWAKEHIRNYSNIKVVYGGDVIDEKMIGTIASMLIHSELQIDQPLIAYAESDNSTFKVSARANPSIIERGVDLSVVMRSVCQELGISNPAGGHPPAAGAKIPTNLLKEFIEKTDLAVGKMLTQKKEK